MSHIHLFKPGTNVTFTAGADITAGRLVEITGDREVSPATADSTKVFGAAATDTKEGDRVLVLRGGVQHLTASAAIAAGDRVAAATGGLIATTTDAGIGLALTGGAANKLVEIALD